MGTASRRTTRVTDAVKNTAPTRTRLKGIIGSVLRRRINKSEKQLRPQVLQYLEAYSDVGVSAHHPATLQSNDLAPWAIPDFTAHCMWLSDPRSLCTSREVLKGRFQDHARTNELAYHTGSTVCPAGIGYSNMRSTPVVFSPGVLSREDTPHQLVKAEVEAATAGCSDKVVSVANDRLSKTERATETTHQADADRPMPVVTRAGARHERPWDSGAAHADWTYEEFTRVKSAAFEGFARAMSTAPHDPFHSDWLGIIGCANGCIDEIKAELEDDFQAIGEQEDAMAAQN